MPLLDSDFNNFATTLTRRFSDRSKGLDPDSRRIIAARPSDRILAGFLTPVRSDQSFALSFTSEMEDADGESTVDVALADDLPRDSAYEQTSLGLEWMVALDEMQEHALIDVEIGLSVYVRRLPTFDEQNSRKVWERPAFNSATQVPSTAIPGTDSPRVCRFVAAWSHEEVLPIRKQIDMAELRTRRRIAIDISQEVTASWTTIDKALLYPGRRALTITEPDLASKPIYDAKVDQLHSTKIPVQWKPVIDARLIATPTEPGCARIALRLINQTEQIKDQFLDFVDPNLYAVRVKISVPRNSHRMSLFRELPNSYRYNRSMFGVGINSHVEGHVEGTDLVLKTDSVPIKRVDRLEPRAVPDAQPSFKSLVMDPVPILTRILDDMTRYTSEDWAMKIGNLSGIERDEAVSARDRFADEIMRLERGVQLLANSKYEKVRRAFSLMNEAMRNSAGGAYEEWRLFQIVFIVSQLPILASREYPELSRDDDDQVDVLWFAAGGGKTEAFLGLIVWQAFFDRLRGKHFGLAAYVRSPLR